MAIQSYIDAVNSGSTTTQAFEMHMRGASSAAQTYVQSMNFAALSTDTYGQQAKMAEIATIAQNKSFASARSILNTYNTELSEVGLSSQQFTQSVAQGNPVLGRYLANVGVGNATMRGYVGTLIAAKAATIGLTIAQTALNAVVGFGLGLVVQFIMSGLSKALEAIKEACKSTEEKMSDLNTKFQEISSKVQETAKNFQQLKSSVSNIAPRFAELSKGVDNFGNNVSLTEEQYSEFLKLNNELAEMFPELNTGFDSNGNAMLALTGSADTLKESLLDLVEAQRKLANEEITKQIPDQVSNLKDYEKVNRQTIKDYENRLKDYKDAKTDLELRHNEETIANAKALWGDAWQEEMLQQDQTSTFAVEAQAIWGSSEEDKESWRAMIEDFISEDGITIDWYKLLNSKEFQNRIAGMEKSVNDFEQTVKDKWKSLAPYMNSWVQTDDTYNDLDDQTQKVVSKMVSNLEYGTEELNESEEIKKYIKDKILTPLQNATPEVKQAFSDMFNISTNDKSTSDYIKDIEDKAKDIASKSDFTYDEVLKNTGFDSIIKQYKESADSIVNSLKGTYNGTEKELKEKVNQLSPDELTKSFDYIEKYGLKTWDELESALKEKTFNIVVDIDTKKEELDNLITNVKQLSDIIDDYNNNGHLSLENIETLMSVGDEYISTLFDENGQLNLNKESYAKLAKAKLEDIRYSMLENAISNLNQLSKSNETTANSELAQSTGNLTEETLRLVAAKKLAEGVDSGQIQKIINTYSQWSAIIDNAEAGLENNIDATLGLESASNELKDSLEDEKKSLEKSKSALEDKKNALEDIKSGYENAIDSIKSLIDWTEKYIKQTKEDEIKSLEDKKKSVDDLIESQKELLQAQKDEYDWNKEISDKQNTVAKDALAASIANLDDSSAGKKSQKEATDTLSESRSDMTDSLYEHSIDSRIDALDKLKDSSDEYYDSEIDKINEFLDNEVTLYKAACSMIDNDNGTLYGNLLNYCKTYTTTSEAEFNYMWTSAQSAMQDYNIANLDTFNLLNNLQVHIYEVDTAIDTIADSIQSYEDKISGVQTKLDSLSDSAQTAVSNISAALNKESELNKAKWYYDWQGKRYESSLSNKDSAIQDILRRIENKYGGRFPASAATIYGTIKHYAKGTRNSNGGLSVTQEDGFEAIFGKLQSGEYTMMPEGSQVFSNKMTDNLFNFSADPQRFITKLSGKFNYLNYFDSIQGNIDRKAKNIVNNSRQKNIGDITVNSAPIYIQGDATQSTVNALRAEADKIVNRTTKNVMNIALRNKNII